MKLTTTSMPDNRVLFTFRGVVGGVRLESSGFWEKDEVEKNIDAIKKSMEIINLPFTHSTEVFDDLMTRVIEEKVRVSRG